MEMNLKDIAGLFSHFKSASPSSAAAAAHSALGMGHVAARRAYACVRKQPRIIILRVQQSCVFLMRAPIPSGQRS